MTKTIHNILLWTVIRNSGTDGDVENYREKKKTSKRVNNVIYAILQKKKPVNEIFVIYLKIIRFRKMIILCF